MGEILVTAVIAVGLLGLAGLAAWRSRRDVPAVLTLFVILVCLVPAGLVLPGVGGIGTPANVVALLCLVWWICAKIVPSLGLTHKPQPVRFAVFLFVATAVLSYALSYTRHLSDLEVSGADRGLIGLAAMVGVTLIAVDGLMSRRDIDVLLQRMLLVIGVVASIGVVQFFLQIDVTPYLKPPGLVENREIFTAKVRRSFARPYSTALHPIEFSVVLAAALPLALHYAMACRDRSRATYKWGLVFLLAAGTAMGVSRSGILGLVVGMLVLSLRWSWRRRLNFAFVGILFIGLLKVLVPGLIGTLRGLIVNASDDPSIQGRLEDIQIVKGFLAERPLVGRGYGTFNTEEYFVLDNEYYRTLVEGGLLGFFALAFLIAVSVILANRTAKGRDGDSDNLGQALMASILVCAAAMATFSALSYAMFSGILFLLVGCAGAYWRICQLDEGEGSPEKETSPELSPTGDHESVGTAPTVGPAAAHRRLKTSRALRTEQRRTPPRRPATS